MKSKPSFLQRLAYTPRGNALGSSVRYLKQARIATSLTLMVLGIALALPTIFGLLVLNVGDIDVSSEEANSLTLYLHTHVSDLQGVELAAALQQREDIEFTHYISSDEALETFNQHFSLADATESLDENPLPGAIMAVMAVNDDDETRIKLLASELKKRPEVELVKYDLQWLKRLHAILDLLSRGIVMIGMLLVITALLVIGNTIRLEMLRRSDEIIVAHLIGASASEIRRPFLYSGFIYGLLGGVFAWILVFIVISLLHGPAQELAGLYGNSFNLKGLSASNSAIMILFSTLLGVLGSWLAVRWQISQIMTQRS